MKNRRRLDRRNATERALDDKLVITLAALATIPILWLTKTYLGVGQRLFELATGAALPALFFLAAWIFGRLRPKPLTKQVVEEARREEEVEQARRIRLLQDGPH